MFSTNLLNIQKKERIWAKQQSLEFWKILKWKYKESSNIIWMFRGGTSSDEGRNIFDSKRRTEDEWNSMQMNEEKEKMLIGKTLWDKSKDVMQWYKLFEKSFQ